MEYADKLVGKTWFFFKLYKWENIRLDDFLAGYWPSEHHFHPHSYVSRYFYSMQPKMSNRTGEKVDIVFEA